MICYIRVYIRRICVLSVDNPDLTVIFVSDRVILLHETRNM